MANLPSKRMFGQRPPGAKESFEHFVQEPQRDLERRTLQETMPAGLDTLAPGIDTTVPRAPSPLRFEEIYSSPENQVFKVVFFPDRVFHARYLNATRAPERYRYAVSEARSILDISVLKAQVFMDGRKLADLVRIEYRASRLVELARETGRFLREHIIGWVRLEGQAAVRDQNGHPVLDEDGHPAVEDRIVEHPVKLQYCPWINAYQVEIWQTLEPPSREMKHHFQVLAQMGPTAPITRIGAFSPLIERLDELKAVELAFRENDVDLPFGMPIDNPRWDNNYERSYQVPNSPFPSDNDANTVPVNNYKVSFQKGWHIDANQVEPVRYRNAMMEADPGNPDFVPADSFPEWNNPAAWEGDVPDTAFKDANVIEMRWLLQREFGGSVVFFHEVTIPVGTVEGTHKHIGSEELYYIVSGNGEAYMAVGDDPNTADLPTVVRPIYGLFEQECVTLEVGPGHVIFTKSGGVHGIRNTGNTPLKFIAFLYHSV